MKIRVKSDKLFNKFSGAENITILAIASYSCIKRFKWTILSSWRTRMATPSNKVYFIERRHNKTIPSSKSSGTIHFKWAYIAKIISTSWRLRLSTNGKWQNTIICHTYSAGKLQISQIKYVEVLMVMKSLLIINMSHVKAYTPFSVACFFH